MTTEKLRMMRIRSGCDEENCKKQHFIEIELWNENEEIIKIIHFSPDIWKHINKSLSCGAGVSSVVMLDNSVNTWVE